MANQKKDEGNRQQKVLLEISRGPNISHNTYKIISVELQDQLHKEKMDQTIHQEDNKMSNQLKDTKKSQEHNSDIDSMLLIT